MGSRAFVFKYGAGGSDLPWTNSASNAGITPVSGMARAYYHYPNIKYSVQNSSFVKSAINRLG
jgi:hypothetical protein